MTMLRCFSGFFIFYAFLCFHCIAGTNPSKKIFFNGKIFNGKDNKLIQAIVIKDSKIIYAGSDIYAKRYIEGGKCEMRDLKGRTVIPGFHDGNVNFPLASKLYKSERNFRNLSVESIVHRLKNIVKRENSAIPIFGYLFEHLLYSEKKWPNKYDLDKISLENPIIIFDPGGNSAWVNSRTLKNCGIDKNTKNLSGGRIERFEDGDPTGILLGRAVDLLGLYSFDNGLNQGNVDKDMIYKAVKYANSFGITSVTTNGDLKFVQKIKELETEKKLSLRFNISLPSKFLGRYLIKGINFNEHSENIKIRMIRERIDGSLFSSGAALFSPYSADHYGLIRSGEMEIRELIQLLSVKWIIPDFFAEGDRSVNSVLNAIDRSKRRREHLPLYRITNLKLIIKGDINRLKRNNVVPVIQPGLITAQLDHINGSIGERGTVNAFKIGTLVNSGVKIGFGTGWPEAALDPRIGLYFSVFRVAADSPDPNREWYIEEKISVKEAIKAYTSGSSFAAGDDLKNGTIEKGKNADFIILNGDIFSNPSSKEAFFKNLEVVETVLGGQTVYKKRAVGYSDRDIEQPVR